MVFSTNAFLFLFLPAFLALYYALPFRFRSAWILLASYAFYAWWRVDFVALFFLTTVWTYLAGRIVAANRDARPRRARAALVTGVAGNLGVLAYFKYADFGVESLGALIRALGGSGLSSWGLLLPIGISFYVFQAVSYLIDVHRGDTPAARSFWVLSAVIALFPQLIAGPILRYKDVAHQFERRAHSFALFSLGAQRFMIGFCKKVLVANAVAPLADALFGLQTPAAGDAWIGALAYAIQLFFDFSGYSDMAIGLGMMIGFRFGENFDHPYVSRSITEFWRRWHISLSRWLRDYLYIPLGSNRLGVRRTYVNLSLVMLLGGLWHGAAWTFVLWGAWHGGWLILERYVGARALWPPLPAIVAVLRTLLLVVLGWVTFRAEDFGRALDLYAGMIGIHGWGLSDAYAWQLLPLPVTVLVLAWGLVYLAPWVTARLQRPAHPHVPLAAGRVLLTSLFLLAVLRLSADAYSPFLYFKF